MPSNPPESITLRRITGAVGNPELSAIPSASASEFAAEDSGDVRLRDDMASAQTSNRSVELQLTAPGDRHKMVPPPLPVFHSPLSLLHKPPYEILSGEAQPFFESPDRYRRILDALFPSPARAAHSMISEMPRTADHGPFLEVELDWDATQIADDWLLEAVHAVHDADYVSFLKNIYQEWVAEGGSKVGYTSPQRSDDEVDSILISTTSSGTGCGAPRDLPPP